MNTNNKTEAILIRESLDRIMNTRHAPRKKADPQPWHRKSLDRWEEFSERCKRDRREQEKDRKRHEINKERET